MSVILKRYLEIGVFLLAASLALLFLSGPFRFDVLFVRSPSESTVYLPIGILLLGALVQHVLMEKRAPHAQKKRWRLLLMSGAVFWISLYGLHKGFVKHRPSWQHAHVIGWQRLESCGCGADVSPEDCIDGLGEDIGSCWSKTQIGLIRSVLSLSYISFAATMGLLAGSFISPKQPIRVFISYRRSDSGHVISQIHERLAGRFSSENVFLDVLANQPGEDFVKKMRRYCKLCNSFLLVIGPSWVEELEKRSDSAEPDHVKKEVELALESGAQVLPLLVQGAPMPKESDLLKSGIGALAPLHAIEIKEDPSGAAFSESMDRVVRAIETNEK